MDVDSARAMTMQVTELLKEVRVDYKKTSGVEAHLVYLKKFLEKVPSDEVWCHT